MAEIIRDEIPHNEIVEKKLENKYIRAAQMAHGGSSVDDIVQELGLPRAEVELIAKVNRKKCVYDSPAKENSINDQIFSKSLELPQIETDSLGKTQLDFHQAVHDHKEKEQSGFESVKL
ncbi:MAG: DUF2802 domain-containing protein, partial [Bdellovibrionales bacterium]|nr:DUF2802 domain-containing protein [Bdellovibrionales bacterium]NQZ19867.1 DUF2802 domain-containing protein [Bdellovibrionales bacterium]